MSAENVECARQTYAALTLGDTEAIRDVWTFRGGTPLKLTYFGEDRAAALEAAGLSE